MKTLAQVGVLLLSSLLTLVLSVVKAPVTVYQQAIILLLVISLGIFSKFFGKETKQTPDSWLIQLLDSAVLLASSLIVQLLVISSGGFYSPFLVLFHFYFLGVSFLVSLRTAIAFLVFSLATLALDIYVNPEHSKLFFADIGTALLYTTSFLVIIPLAQYIATKYHFKDELSKILTGQVKLGQSILESLSEVVVVTDMKMNIVSVNEALKKILSKNEADVLDESLFDVLNLRDSDGLPATVQSLSIDRVIAEKTARIINDLLMYVPGRTVPYKVSVQVRPIIGANDQLEKLTLVINQGSSIKGEQEFDHPDLDRAQLTEQQRFQKLKEDLRKLNQPRLSVEVDLLRKIDEDITLASQLEDFPIQPAVNLVDVVAVSQRDIIAKYDFGRNLGVSLEFNMSPSEFSKEESFIKLSKSQDNLDVAISDYAVPTDQKWFEILVSRILDLAILLSKGQGSEVKLAVSRGDNLRINIMVSLAVMFVDEQLEQAVFAKYYQGLSSKSHLYLGSGLEGFIAKTIATQLNIPISVDVDRQSSVVVFKLELSRKAQ